MKFKCVSVTGNVVRLEYVPGDGKLASGSLDIVVADTALLAEFSVGREFSMTLQSLGTPSVAGGR